MPPVSPLSGSPDQRWTGHGYRTGLGDTQVVPAVRPPVTEVRTRQQQLLTLLTAGDPATPLVERVCEVSVRQLGVSGAGMCLIGGRQHQIVVHGTDALAGELADLQVSLGQGPCSEAVRTGQPVLVPELERFHPPGWPVYAGHARARGVRALFSFPLHAGDVQLGALDLYRVTPGPLTEGQLLDAELLTAIAARSMLAQADRLHLDGSVSALHWLSAQHREEVPGTGRAVDLGITVAEALAPVWADGANDALGDRPQTCDTRR